MNTLSMTSHVPGSGPGRALNTRADVAELLAEWLAPLAKHLNPDATRAGLGVNAAHYGHALAGLEGYARALWGLVPLLAGGGKSALAQPWLQGLRNGTNPHHPGYWGVPGDSSQALVEMPAIALAAALAPDFFWTPLSQQEQGNLTRWLLTINDRALVDNNWLYFRVIVNAALARLGEPHDPQAVRQALDRVQEFALGNGWFSDGEINADQNQVDYYVPFGFHFYGLLYAALSHTPEGERETRLRQQARVFAPQFREWFARSGAALPFGRSLTYRFAQGAFWGAAAFAGEEVLPWGEVKHLWFQHLRWWAAQPMFTPDGLLSIGYGYPTLNVSEQYNSPASPYWAFKFFLPLALPDTHPFWQAQEVVPPFATGVCPQPEPGMLLCRDDADDHVFALSGRQHRLWVRHGAEKYSKFAYSTHFGFSVPGGAVGEEHAAPDSTLLLSEDGQHWRGREGAAHTEVSEQEVTLTWQPFPDVTVRTRLIPHLPGHLRLHDITTGRPLHVLEGGWPLGARDDWQQEHLAPHDLLLSSEEGYSRIADLAGQRPATFFKPDPNTNVLHPRTAVPTLRCELPAGQHRLGCFVLARRQQDDMRQPVSVHPSTFRPSHSPAPQGEPTP